LRRERLSSILEKAKDTRGKLPSRKGEGTLSILLGRRLRCGQKGGENLGKGSVTSDAAKKEYRP